MARAASEPKARDRLEVTRMGEEKVDAWWEASVATCQRLCEADLALAGLFWSGLGRGAVAGGL